MRKRKVVINNCYGGFSLSDEAKEKLLKKIGIDIKYSFIVDIDKKIYVIDKINEDKIKKHKWIKEYPQEYVLKHKVKDEDILIYICDSTLPRHMPELVEVVEELKEKANGQFSKLKIVNCNSKIYKIFEYDGLEELIELDDKDVYIICD
jgi:hypothetical protein